jgi:Fic family protein
VQPSDFTSDAPGKVVWITDPKTKESEHHWAFVPAPLPSTLPLDLDTVMLLADAQHALGQLSGTGRQIQNPYLLMHSFLRREAILSSRIEGTITGAEQLLLFEADPTESTKTPDVEEVLNYVRAMEQGLAELGNVPLSFRMIRRLHGTLLSGVRGQNKRPGEFRNESNYIGHQHQRIREARYVPPPVLRMQQALEDLEQFLVEPPRQIPLLIQLAMIHYQFEAIHPFMDGNGRIGRLLVTLLLCERRALPGPLFYLSAYLDKNKDAYMDHLLAVSQRGDWSSWVRFFLNGVTEQSQDAVRRAEQLQDLQRTYKQKIQNARASALLPRLVDELFDTPALTISQVARRLAITPHAAQSNIVKLVDAEILREVTGQRRNRVYIAPEIVNIITTAEETDP